MYARDRLPAELRGLCFAAPSGLRAARAALVCRPHCSTRNTAHDSRVTVAAVGATDCRRTQVVPPALAGTSQLVAALYRDDYRLLGYSSPKGRSKHRSFHETVLGVPQDTNAELVSSGLLALST